MLHAKPKVGLPLILWASRRWFAPVFAACASLGACDGNGTPSDTEPSGTRSNTGKESTDAFDLTTTLSIGSNQLSPGEVTKVGIQVAPPGSYDVKIAISAGGELAFLNDSVLITNSEGYAETTLSVARTGVGKVTLQALVDGAAPVYLDAFVVPPDEAALHLVPVYKGERPFTEWHVAILEEPECPIDRETFLEQDTRTFTRVAPGEPILLDGIPTGRPLSLLVRAEEYAFGCAPGVIVTNDAREPVEVNVIDEPLIVDDLSFGMRFGVYVNSEPFWGDLSTYLTTIGGAFRGAYEADSVALLSKMEELASSPEAFRNNREAKAWDTLLELRLSAAGASQGLTSRIQRWLFDGAQLLQAQTAMLGRVEATEPAAAKVELASVASLDPADVGISKSEVAATLNTSGTDDFVRLAFTFEFEPSRLFGALASQVVTNRPPTVLCRPPDNAVETPDAGATDAGGSEPIADGDAVFVDASLMDAGSSDAGVVDPPSALADSVGCSTVGLWLSENTGYAYEGCDAVCATRLCEDAISALWQQVLDADVTKKTMQVSAAGRAKLDARAHVIGLTSGEWIGTTDLFRTDPKGTLQGCTGSLAR